MFNSVNTNHLANLQASSPPVGTRVIDDFTNGIRPKLLPCTNKSQLRRMHVRVFATTLKDPYLNVKVKVHTLDIAPLRSESPPKKRSGMARVLTGSHSFTCTPTPQLVLIYRPRRDGRLSRPWREVAQADIQTRNLPIANSALYHTATSAHRQCCT